MRTFLLAAALAAILCGCKHAPPVIVAHYDWVLKPDSPGPDLPPVGRSLFDSLVSPTPPFPFEKLLNAIDTQLGTPVQAERILIPLGRSLQRNAGSPDFFKYPRALVVFDAEAASGVVVKDRLFLAYHEKAGVIEVISYNEEAGRFEFQIVKNYRGVGKASVAYARRKVCTACHQNQAPIFPTQLWDETNANPAVSRLLLAEQREFYGFPVAQTADAANRIDQAVHRANFFSTYQLLWASATPQQRARLGEAALRCRLGASCAPSTARQPVADQWRKHWPGGLAIPNPEIPSRNPLAILSREGSRDRPATLAFLARRQMNIDTEFEPANPRPPLEVWQLTDPRRLAQLVMGLGSFFPEHDLAPLKCACQPQCPPLDVSRFASIDLPVFRPSAILREAIAAIRLRDSFLGGAAVSRAACVFRAAGSPKAAR